VKIIASYNVKGGVGKTSTAVNLAYLCAEGGRRTLLWDLDPQGAATFLFRVKPRVKGGSAKLVSGKRPLDGALRGSDYPGLDLLPADFTYRNMDIDLANNAGGGRLSLSRLLDGLADDFDVAFLDTPPSLSLVSENVLRAADVVLVPVIPTVLAVRTFDQLTDFVGSFDGHRPQVRAFFSMADRRRKLHRTVLAELPAQRAGISPIAIPAAALIEEMTVRREPVPVYAPRSAAAQAYRALWNEVAELL
jgi:chromosome partitioning protein